MRWHFKDMMRKRWARIWLSIFVFTIVVFIANLWMKSHLEIAENNDGIYSVNQRVFYDHWGKNPTDHEWLIKYRESRRTDIPTFVVEEHYEVVKYWFQAAELGLISKSRNVLLHIDGHIDAAFPEDAESIPWFRFPKSEDEIHNMMQRNDMFIVTAALTGFLDHVIWVWPTWVASSDKEAEEYAHAVFDIYLGYARVKSITSGGYDNDLCICLKASHSSSKTVDAINEWICKRKNKTVVSMEEGLAVSQSQCSRQMDGVLEIVSENLAASALAKHKWSDSKKLLLDIDEDFFGCWSDIIPLHESRLSQDKINVLSDLVSYIFCVSISEEEQLADRIYVSLLSLIKTLKLKSCENSKLRSRTKCWRNVEIDNFIILRMEEIEHFFIQRGFSDIMCESGAKVRGLFMQSLMSYLLNFTIEQLDALMELGICLDVSPPSIHYSSSGKFRVCHGDNTPNKTSVLFYLPNKDEINSRAMKLRHTLLSLSKSPDFISICRSIRDGYTPKLFFPFIEQTLMKNIHSVFRQTQSNYVHYDQNLLGGKTGWSSRHQPLVFQLLQFLQVN